METFRYIFCGFIGAIIGAVAVVVLALCVNSGRHRNEEEK